VHALAVRRLRKRAIVADKPTYERRRPEASALYQVVRDFVPRNKIPLLCPIRLRGHRGKKPGARAF
jgi:hypothetical protein